MYFYDLPAPFSQSKYGKEESEQKGLHIQTCSELQAVILRPNKVGVSFAVVKVTTVVLLPSCATKRAYYACNGFHWNVAVSLHSAV